MYLTKTKSRMVAVSLLPALMLAETYTAGTPGVAVALLALLFSFLFMRFLPSWYETYHSAWKEAGFLVFMFAFLLAIIGEFYAALCILMFGWFGLYTAKFSYGLWRSA